MLIFLISLDVSMENEIVTLRESTKQPFGLCVERKLDNCTATFGKALTTEYCLNLIIFISVHGQVIQEVVNQGCPTNKPHQYNLTMNKQKMLP